MTFIPEGQCTALSGEQEMVDYQFGKKALHHKFCPVCGIRPFSRSRGPDGSPMVMVNVRCLDGIDAAQLEIKTRYDGRSL